MLELVFLVALAWGAVVFAAGAIVAVGAAADDSWDGAPDAGPRDPTPAPPEDDVPARRGRPPSAARGP